MKRKATRNAVIIALAVVTVNTMLIWGLSGASSVSTPLVPQTAQASGATVNLNRPEVLVIRLAFHNNAERDRLASEWGADEASTAQGYLTIWTDRTGYNKMLAEGLPATIDEVTTHQANNPNLFGKNSPDTFNGGYKTVEEIYTFLDQEVAAYPNLAVKVNIGQSWCALHAPCVVNTVPNWNGYQLYALHITNQSIAGPKPVYWYDAGIHAREIAVPEVAMRYIDYLLSHYNTDADAHWLVDYHDIWVMPTANPDGHHLVEQGGNNPYLQRKNANYSNGCTTFPPGNGQLGTDNNRNFGFQWNCCGGSSSDPCSEVYHGASGASDPETLAIENKVSSLIPVQRTPDITSTAPLTSTGVYQNMHSSAMLDLYPWGFSTGASPNGTQFANIGAHMSASDAYPAGNGYQACQPPNCLYAVDGDAFDWAYGALGAAGVTTEIGGGSFFPPYSSIDSSIWPDNRGALLYEAKIARTPYMMAYGPDAITASGTPITVTQGSLAHLTASINYAWSGDTLAQNVGAAEYYLDTPPWAGGTAVPMSGTFGSSQTVAVSANIDTAAIATGRHILFVRGRGVNNIPSTQYQTWGPISAQFLDVTPAGGATPTPTNTQTSTPVPATTTPTQTSTPVPATNTPIITATSTPIITATSTPAITSTATPGVPSPTPTDCPNPFVDVTGNVFYKAIHTLNCAGAINGTDATHFSPAGTSSRGQFAKVVVLGFGTPLYTPATQDFVDVPPSYFGYLYIESGFHASILSGFDPATCAAHGLGNPCYLPNQAITRGQLTKLVVNAGGYQLITPAGGTQDFVDVPPSNVFYVSIETAYTNGLVSGYPGRLFLPNANIRRDEMAQIVYEGIIHRP